MEQLYIEDKTFDNIDFKENPLKKGEYENCDFINCDFSNSDLSDIKFSDCHFADCNLSLTKLSGTVLLTILHFIKLKSGKRHSRIHNYMKLILQKVN